jgi:hypothetical protein
LLVRADAPGGQKNISSNSNYFVAVNASDGFMDVAGGLTCVAECGEKHVVVSKQAVRQKEVPVVELTRIEKTLATGPFPPLTPLRSSVQART